MNIDKHRGSLLGLAIGDALGTTLEFTQRDTQPPLEDMVGGGPFTLKPGQWTDDTSMALCLGDSLLACEGINLKDQLERYTGWWTQGHNSVTGSCFDIGNTVRSALEYHASSGDVYAGSKSRYSAGNGSIMRLAPVCLFFSKDPHLALEAAAESSKTTHGASECLESCQLLAHIIIAFLEGKSREEVLCVGFLSGIEAKEAMVIKIIEGSYKRKSREEIKGSGYVIDSLEAALWAFWNHKDFKAGALAAVNLGDDADTTGAVYGQIAGAYYGETGIPSDWLEKVYWRSEISEMAKKLSKGIQSA